MTRTRNLSGRLTTGTLIILIGLLLLLTTTDVIEIESIWEWIPLVFVLIGVWALLRSRFRNLVGPVMIIAIAGVFFLRNVGLIPDDAIGTWWPLFIVLFGLLIIINRSRRRQRIRLEGSTDAKEVTAIGVFGTDERRLSTDRFTGAELIAIFGDALLDLRNAGTRNQPAIIEVASIFGDVEIRTTTETEVKLEVLNIFGETRDRRPVSDAEESTGDEADPELIITGVAIFGDVTVRD